MMIYHAKDPQQPSKGQFSYDDLSPPFMFTDVHMQKIYFFRYEKAAADQQFTMEKFKTNAKRLKDVKESVSDFSQKIR